MATHRANGAEFFNVNYSLVIATRGERYGEDNGGQWSQSSVNISVLDLNYIQEI